MENAEKWEKRAGRAKLNIQGYKNSLFFLMIAVCGVAMRGNDMAQ